MSHDDAFAAFVAEKRDREARDNEGRVTWRRIDRHQDDGRGWSGIDGLGRLYYICPAGGPDRDVYEFGIVAAGGARIPHGLARGPDDAKAGVRAINYPKGDTDGDSA